MEKEFGDYVRKLHYQSRLTIEEVCSKMQKSRTTLYAIFDGKRGIKIEDLISLSEIYQSNLISAYINIYNEKEAGRIDLAIVSDPINEDGPKYKKTEGLSDCREKLDKTERDLHICKKYISFLRDKCKGYENMLEEIIGRDKGQK